MTALAINLNSLAGYTDRFRIYAFLYVMLLIFLYGLAMRKYKVNGSNGSNCSTNKLLDLFSSLLEVIWVILALLVLTYFDILTDLIVILIRASIRIYKFRILIQDFIIYMIDTFEYGRLEEIEIR